MNIRSSTMKNTCADLFNRYAVATPLYYLSYTGFHPALFKFYPEDGVESIMLSNLQNF